MRGDGGGSEERASEDFARQQERGIAQQARGSSVTPGYERLDSLDRDQPPTANLDRAERSGGHELV
jgi:hypothetical protein